MTASPLVLIRSRLLMGTLRVALVCTLVSGSVFGGERDVSNSVPVVGQDRAVGWFSDLPILFQGSDESFINEVSATGMVQYQGVLGESSYGSISDAEFRRFRFGGRILFGDHFLISTSANFNPESASPFYDDLSQSYLSWSPFGNDKKAMQRFMVSAGKIKPRFTREYSTSAKRISTFERSLLVNQLSPSKATGLWIGGSENKWSYVLAGFSGDEAAEYSEFRHGFLGLAKIGYDISEIGTVGLDYLYGTSAQEITAPIDHAFSLSTEWNINYQGGPCSLVSDLIFSNGRESDLGDAWGVVIMPGWQLTDQLELVARYQFADSNSEDGLRLQKRYERAVAGPVERGDRYHAGYLGLNYYVNDHKLKLMTGVEYSHMSGPADVSALTWFSGVRFYF